VSNTKRRVRALKSASTRAARERRAAGARLAKAASAQATPASAATEASARAGARFIVIERTGSDRREAEPGCPFMVVEAATTQVPENFFGRDWIGYHSTRELADIEANELNALAGHFLVTTQPVIGPSAAPVMADLKSVLGSKATAWAAELLAPTQEMPAIPAEDDEPSRLPGAENLRAVVDEIAHRPQAPAGQSTGERYAHILRAAGWEPPASGAKLDGPSARVLEESFRKDIESADGPADAPRGPVDGGGRQEHRDIAQRTLQLPRITDTVHTSRPGRDSHASPIIPGLRRALIYEILAGQQVLCTDGSWRTTAGGSLRDGAGILVMADLTEHAVDADVRFWVRAQPTASAAAGLHHRPACPNGCFRTQADYRLCTCNWGCGCSPHPAPRATTAHTATDTRELHLTGAVA